MIDFSGADYLSDNNEFSMIFDDQCNRLRLVHCKKICYAQLKKASKVLLVPDWTDNTNLYELCPKNYYKIWKSLARH